MAATASTPGITPPAAPGRPSLPTIAPSFDRFGRRIDYLRISLTDRRNLRCVYCMPATVVLSWLVRPSRARSRLSRATSAKNPRRMS